MAETESSSSAAAAAVTAATTGADDLVQRVTVQLEFYFSDNNMSRDNFMKAELAKNGGFIPVTVLATFKKLQHMCGSANLVDTIKAAAEASTELELTEDKNGVRRLNELPESVDFDPVTTYTKGWHWDTTIDQIKESMSVYGTVKMVRPRQKVLRGKKVFKGSALVEYATAEQSEAANKAEHIVNGRKVITQSKKEWWDSKQAWFESQKAENPDFGKPQKRKAKELDTKSADKSDEPSLKKQKVDDRDESIVLEIDGLGNGVTREVIREEFATKGEVAYIDFSRDDAKGYVRMANQAGADAVLAASGMKILDYDITVKNVTGAELDAYWTNFNEQKQARLELADSRGPKGGRGGKNFRGRGRGRGRR